MPDEPFRIQTDPAPAGVRFNVSPVRSVLTIGGGAFELATPYPMPNRFWRFWQWLLLGLRWRSY